jgi:serine/threonine protein phosphatase PrpC
VTFVIIDGLVITVGSVGDSRAVLEAEGSLYYLSADHRLEENEEEYVLQVLSDSNKFNLQKLLVLL